MSLIELRQAKRDEAISGGAMDKVIESRRIDKRILIAGGAAAILVLLLIFWFFAPSADSQTVSRDRLWRKRASPEASTGRSSAAAQAPMEARSSLLWRAAGTRTATAHGRMIGR